MNDGPGNGDGDIGPVGIVDESQTVAISVNGVTIQVTRVVKVRNLIEQAKAAGAIEGLVEEYVLERVAVEGEIGIEQTITVNELEQFLAVPIGKTEVA